MDRTQTKVDVESSQLPEQLRGELETTLYRILQEILANVEKHAEARNVNIDCYVEDAFVVVNVEDDGKGFDVASVKRESWGLGLHNMRERAALVGGTLDLESIPGRGTEICIKIPLDAEKVSPAR